MITKRIYGFALLIVFVVAITIPCAVFAAEVVQGKCKAIDEQAQTLTIEIYDIVTDDENPYGKPTGQDIVIDYSNSLVGLQPELGNVLRIAFVKKADINSAIRLMNITRQGLLNK